MITQQKIAATKRALKRGTPPGELYNQLIKEGYSEDDIKKVFTPHKYDMRSWYLTFGIIFVIGGIWIYPKLESLLLFVSSGILLFLYYKERIKVEKERSQ